MDSEQPCSTREPRCSLDRLLRLGAAPLLLAAALAPACRADSTLQAAAPGTGPVSASAHLDFRVTVLPTLALATQAGGVRVQGNSGTLTLQRDSSAAWDGRAPNASTSLRPRRQVVDAALPTPPLAGSDRVTIASP